MLWARMLAYVTGMVNQELLLQNEYLGAENRILRGKIKGRLLLSEGEKVTLAEQQRTRTPFSAGTESSSPTNSTDRSFVNESVDRELMRKQNG
jgi:hypothetical protein